MSEGLNDLKPCEFPNLCEGERCRFLGAETRLLTSSLTASNRSSVGGGSVSNGTVIMLKNDMSFGAK